MINRIVLVGRLTRDPEIKKTQNGLSVADFTVACDRRYSGGDRKDRKADFINCVAWRQSADYLGQYAHKGAIVGVEGRLQIDNYDDKDGRRVYKTTVQCDNVKLISGYGNQEHSATQKADSDASFEEYMRDAPALEISSDYFPF
ncbi:single-stranded DNA-binding protein [Holdemania sp. Marseille-P2844]|jgi:single-strand DNA-binding protein|uniref:single-stranded DNA-binding protein n=1 Tax=Holdemania sp. Marseille-P2844 TaxID=1852366 RepID=UPI000933C359|nr:single-stranded DNA-binding protein [Holdemania sp. Marseille-P2844]